MKLTRRRTASGGSSGSSPKKVKLEAEEASEEVETAQHSNIIMDDGTVLQVEEVTEEEEVTNDDQAKTTDEDDTSNLQNEEANVQLEEGVEVNEGDEQSDTVILQDGQIIQAGQIIQSGEIIQEGSHIVEESQIIQDGGQIILEENQIIQGDHIIQEGGHIIQEDGQIIEGQIIQEGGQIINEDGQIIEGQIMQEGDQIIQEEDQIIQEEGHIIEGQQIIQRGMEEDDVQLHISEEGQGLTLSTTDTLQTETISSETTEETQLNPPPQFQNIIIQHMDIAEPLTTLKRLLESKLQCSLDEHQFYLQDQLELDESKNLVEQCVKGEGTVQVNVEVKSQPGQKPKINIVDILKPAEEEEVPSLGVQEQVVQAAPAPTKVVIPFPEEANQVTRWIVDQAFRKEQERLKIPFDPSLWNRTHVRHWIQWAQQEFSLVGVDSENFNITGKQLVSMDHATFTKMVPVDNGDTFWTHLELLRKCKFVAVLQQPTPNAITTITVSTSEAELLNAQNRKSFHKHVAKMRAPRLTGDDKFGTAGNRTGNNGQIQLWQFLLELLTDKECREIIHWIGEEGEFKLLNPEMVAQLWGQRKNKPTMNYEKLSRALRYYYDGDMIAKVHGKRFVYKFICDLRMLLGYSAGELAKLVEESAQKKLAEVREHIRPGMSTIRRQLVSGVGLVTS
ncbi:unnamed protein product [Owenia fusiformis]|uniref:Uncharacterized protein n=1 Tax=Owenia fusiformis TaxID=6347 RepID=A0A8J1TYH2_OWEFU|nr:unnamed protein product [Owenia fusiformis]